LQDLEYSIRSNHILLIHNYFIKSHIYLRNLKFFEIILSFQKSIKSYKILQDLMGILYDLTRSYGDIIRSYKILWGYYTILQDLKSYLIL
jgi:hypothetical protein